MAILEEKIVSLTETCKAFDGLTRSSLITLIDGDNTIREYRLSDGKTYYARTQLYSWLEKKGFFTSVYYY